MSALILTWAIGTSQVLLAVAMSLSAWRVARGPRAQDRVLALDSLYLGALLLLVTFGIRTGSAVYFEIALVISVLSFVATMALSKFLMRGEVIE